MRVAPAPALEKTSVSPLTSPATSSGSSDEKATRPESAASAAPESPVPAPVLTLRRVTPVTETGEAARDTVARKTSTSESKTPSKSAACDVKATTPPLGLMDASVLLPLPGAPPAVRDTRTVVPAAMSRT